MGDVGSSVNALSNLFTSSQKPTLSNLENAGYQQYGGASGPQLNMGAYGPVTAAQEGTAQAQNTNVNVGQANQFLGGQQGLVAQLQAQAAGQGPNPAQQQYEANTQQAIAQQAALGAARGNQNPGLQANAQANQAAQLQQAMAGQSAINQSNQQLAAEGQLGQALGSYGGQQIGLAENQAGLNQQTSMANLNAQQGAMNANMGAQNATNQFNTASAQQGNNAQQAQFQYQNSQADQSINQTNQVIGQMATNSANSANTALAGAVGGAMNGGGAAATANWGGGSNPGSGIGTSDGGSSNTGQADFSGNYNASAAPDGSSFDYVGGAFTKPTVKTIGERGPEAVVPLDGSQGDPHKFLDAMIAHVGKGQSGKAAPSAIDQLAEALAEALKARKRK